MTRRIIQFATGNVGKHSLRTIIGRPDLELVGVHAHSPAKIGLDAAELCGLDAATGITATNDIDALIALEADCIMYTTQGESRGEEPIKEMAAFLAAGTNVVTTTPVWLLTPDHAEEWMITLLEEACKAGNTSLYCNGIDPGFSGDTLVYTALSLAGRATAITIQEICDYGTYDDPNFTGVYFGFGTSPDNVPHIFMPGLVASTWGGQVRTLADQLGVELDEVRERHENWATPERIECAMMTVEPGQVAAVRFAAEGVLNGKVVITMEHVNRLTNVAAPDWEYPPEGRPGVHRVIVEGDPGIEINTHVGRHGVDHNQAGLLSTAVRALNLVEAVCMAPSGLFAAHDVRPTDHVRGMMW